MDTPTRLHDLISEVILIDGKNIEVEEVLVDDWSPVGESHPCPDTVVEKCPLKSAPSAKDMSESHRSKTRIRTPGHPPGTNRTSTHGVDTKSSQRRRTRRAPDSATRGVSPGGQPFHMQFAHNTHTNRDSTWVAYKNKGIHGKKNRRALHNTPVKHLHGHVTNNAHRDQRALPPTPSPVCPGKCQWPFSGNARPNPNTRSPVGPMEMDARGKGGHATVSLSTPSGVSSLNGPRLATPVIVDVTTPPCTTPEGPETKRLSRLKKDELKRMCLTRNLPILGFKAALVGRLVACRTLSHSVTGETIAPHHPENSSFESPRIEFLQQ